jgi:single-strand DNA-binding protein
MFNHVTLVGRLGRDPEIRRTTSGDAVATMSVATSERWSDKVTGEKKERTEWTRVVIFNDAMVTKFVEPHVHKGDLVLVHGKLQTRKWQDQSGADRYSTEVVLTTFGGELKLLDKNEGRPAPSESDYGTTKTQTNGGDYAAARAGDRPAGGVDDDIPF